MICETGKLLGEVAKSENVARAAFGRVILAIGADTGRGKKRRAWCFS
jgi:hypothetical protein